MANGKSDSSIHKGSSDILTTSAVGLLALLTAQLLVGFLLSRNYHATIASAHADVSALRAGGGLDRFLLGFHYWGSAALIILSFFHLIAMAVKGRFGGTDRLRWVASLAIFLCALGFQFTGNLLPMDRHDVQTVVVEAGISAGAPILGPTVKAQTLNGPSFGEPTLQRWNALHAIVIPVASITLVLVGFAVFLRRGNGSPNWPFAAIPVVLAAGLSFLGTPTGVASTPDDYMAYDALASWYSWPLHGSLRLFQSLSPSVGWIGALVMPGLFVGFMVLMPLVSGRVASNILRGVFLLFVAYFALAALLFGGKFAPIVGDQGPKETAAAKVVGDKLDPALAAKGRDIFNTKGCASCHGQDGKNGDSGPDLTGEEKKGRSLDWITQYVTNPTAVKPSSTMPAFGTKLKVDEIKSIAQFLLAPKAK